MGLFKNFKDEFKDIKEDFKTAVDEIVPGGESLGADKGIDKDGYVDTLSGNLDVRPKDVQSELSKLDELLESVKAEPVKVEPVKAEPVKPVVEVRPEVRAEVRPEVKVETRQEVRVEARPEVRKEIVTEEGYIVMDATMIDSNVVLDETSIITASTTLTGNIASAGSFDVQGTVNGNVSCNGKLIVTGMINGNSTSSEFFADSARVEGEVVSSGTVKIGAGSVIIGNITASSAVIAGAVKGDIDVQGPVVIDTSAVIYGNIKSRSVQINNGAIIEGFCSQCYAEVDIQSIFSK